MSAKKKVDLETAKNVDAMKVALGKMNRLLDAIYDGGGKKTDRRPAC